jgi:predicted O-methyltransferase YrrM
MEAWAIERLIGGDARFKQAWDVTASVPGSFSKLSAACIFRILDGLAPTRIVEIGSYLGKSTVFFALASKALGHSRTRITSVDPHTGDRQQMERLGVNLLPSLDLFRVHIAGTGAGDMVDVVVARSEDAAGEWTEPVDLLYIDGWHSYDAAFLDGQLWSPFLTADGVVIFDDYTRYPDVYNAVHALAGAGKLRLWGNMFGQALGGHREPSAAARAVMSIANSPLQRRLHRLRA